MSISLGDRDRAVINAFQGGFPIEPRPFQRAASAMSAAGVPISAAELLARIQRLDRRGYLSRFGPLIDATALGGATTLVAARGPEDRFDEVVERINGHPAVAHNYERDHELNLWFVVSVADPGDLQGVLSEIEAATGLETYELPKQEEFYLGARFPVSGPLVDQPLNCTPTPVEPDEARPETLPASERRLLVAVQGGLPLVRRPYRSVADDIDPTCEWVTATLARLEAENVIRRVGVVPNHYAIGYTENAMTVWDVPDEAVSEVGRAVAELDFVTHCYRRPRHEGVWPYNLFAMVHGRSVEAAETRVGVVERTVADQTKLGPGGWEALYSRRILKKRGLRLTDPDSETASTSPGAASPGPE